MKWIIRLIEVEERVLVGEELTALRRKARTRKVVNASAMAIPLREVLIREMGHHRL